MVSPTLFPHEDMRREIRTLGSRLYRIRNTLKGIDPDTGMYDENLIAGLCPNKCSCGVCRAARRADPGYQLYLAKKRKIETIQSRGSVYSDLESRNIDGKVNIILMQWLEAYRTGLKEYHEQFPTGT